MWQEVLVEFISTDREDLVGLGGEVKKSNFLEEGTRCLFPLIPTEKTKTIGPGDIVKILIYTDSPNEDTGMSVKIKKLGEKYELWNPETCGWDKIFEDFSC